MQLILLQKIRNLGDIGDQVRVRSGYGRNFLIPQGAALMATRDNMAVFEARKSELLAASRERETRAQGRAQSLPSSLTLPMRTSEEGKLYGSVGPQEIADALTAEGHAIDAGEVILAEGVFRQVGYYSATLSLHAEVEVEIEIIVAQRTDMGINMPPSPHAHAADEELTNVPQGGGVAAEPEDEGEIETEDEDSDEAAPR